MELIRRQSNLRASDRTGDFLAVLNKLIADSLEGSRESLNPLADEGLMRCIAEGDVLCRDFLDALVKSVEKEVLIVGLLLPAAQLSQFYCMLTGATECDCSGQDLNFTMLQHSFLTGTPTLLLLLNEQTLSKQQRLRQRLLLGLSLVLVTSEKYSRKRYENRLKRSDYAEKRQGRVQKGKDRVLFNKNSSLLLIREEIGELGEDFTNKLDSLFWTVEQNSVAQLQSKSIKRQLTKIRGNYQGLSEQSQWEWQLGIKLAEMGKMALKRNWRVGKGMLCYPFIYFLTYWVKEQSRQSRNLLQAALGSYCKLLQQRFLKAISGLSLPTDELKLRNTISFQKRTILMGARKHLAMLENLYPEGEWVNRWLEGLSKFFADKERQICNINNIEAMKINQTLLKKLYMQIVHNPLESNNTERNLQDYQSDFQKLLDVYGNQSIRVSSQLKTFNQYLADKKMDYADQLARQLRHGHKKYSNEKEQLKDRLEIQTGVLETLQMEIKQLEERRHKIDLQNSLLKNSIDEVHKKRKAEIFSESLSSKKKTELSDGKSYKETKAINKTSKQLAKKESKCCCVVM